MRLFFQQLAKLAVVEDYESKIKKEVDDFVTCDEVTRREPLERLVDRGDDSGLVHLALLSNQLLVE